MDSIGISRKRKNSSSSQPHPLSTPLTRSKSQIFLHRNRSGHLHYDSRIRQKSYDGCRRYRLSPTGFGSDARKRLSEDGGGGDNVDAMVVIEDQRKKEKVKVETFGEGSSGEDICCVMMKYVRPRRAYSPQLSTRACSDAIPSVENGLVEPDIKYQKIGALGFGKSILEVEKCGDENEGFKVKMDGDMNVDDEISMGIVATESPNLGLLWEHLNFDKGNNETSIEGRKMQDDQCDGKNGGSCSKKGEGLSGELALTTPPDAKICDKLEVNGDQGKHIEEISVEDTLVVENAEIHVGEEFCPKDDDSQRNDYVLNGKSALRPRSKEKLFKIPGAVSYKRMFPFLRKIMGDDFGTSKMCYCQENDKGLNGIQEFQLTLSAQSKKEGSKCELKTVNCTVLDTSQCEASEGDELIAHMDELSHGNTSKLQTKEVTTEGFSVPPLNNICLSESKAGPNADFQSVSDGGNVFYYNDFKHDLNHISNIGHALPTNHDGHNSENFGVLNEECKSMTPPEVVICDNPKVIFCQLESMPQGVPHVNGKGLTRSIPENAGEDFCVISDEIKDSPKSKSVPRPNLNWKLFKATGSVSFRRMLPFLKDLTKDPSVMAESKCVKKVASAVHNDGLEPVQNKIYRQHTSESKPEAQNLCYVHGDVCSLASENCSSKEIGFTTNCDERKQFEGVEKHESLIRNPTAGQNQNHLDPNMLDLEKEASSHAIINHVSVSNEESSDKNIYEKLDMQKHGSVKAENDLNAIVYGPSALLKGSNRSASRVRKIRNGSESASRVREIRNGFESKKTTLTKNRCSRAKLLKHDGSFAYKRMLPFILNTMKGVSANHHYPKHQKRLDQTSLLPNSASDLQVTPVSGSNGCIPRYDHRGNSSTQLQAEQVVLNGCCNLESSPDPIVSVHKINSPITPVRPIVNRVIPREEAMTAISVSSIHPEVKGSNSSLISSNGEKTPETQGYCQILSQQKVVEQLRVKKGILKRNPRGCRGLCTCLNCASFRLHAERAFEFSRNQFLEAEEVATDLIKELSHLRNMLERSADPVNGNPVFDRSKVEEASKKAFATEQLAKDRLSQMNDDLNIHCRMKSLQPARVRFTNHVEEKIIQPDR